MNNYELLVNEVEFEFIFFRFWLCYCNLGGFTRINISFRFFLVHFNNKNWYTKIEKWMY